MKQIKVAVYAGAFFLLLLFSGCSFSLGGTPQKKPEISPLEVQRNVKTEMKTAETRKIIEDAAKTEKLDMLLQVPEADRLIQKKITDSFDTPAINRAIQENLKMVLEMPEVQKQLGERVNKSLKTQEVQKELKSAVEEIITKAFKSSGEGGDQGGGEGAAGSSGGIGQ